MAKKKRKVIKPPHILRERKKSEMLVFTQPGFSSQYSGFRKAALLRMAEASWPRYTGTGELVFTTLSPADVARMANIKSVTTVNRWLSGWTYRPNAETSWKIMSALLIPTGIQAPGADPESEGLIFRISDYRLAQARRAEELEETGKKAPKERKHRKNSNIPTVAFG